MIIICGRTVENFEEKPLRVSSMGELCVIPPLLGRPTQFFLTATGDGQGVYNLNGNYSAAPVDFYYQATTRYLLYTMLINIVDTAGFTYDDYGAIAPGIVVNGVKFFIKPNGLAEIPLLSGVAVKYNYQWSSLTSHVVPTQWSGLPQALMIEFNVYDQYGMPITLDIGDQFIVRLNDDFTHLVSHTFGLRGRKY